MKTSALWKRTRLFEQLSEHTEHLSHSLIKQRRVWEEHWQKKDIHGQKTRPLAMTHKSDEENCQAVCLEWQNKKKCERNDSAWSTVWTMGDWHEFLQIPNDRKERKKLKRIAKGNKLSSQGLIHSQVSRHWVWELWAVLNILVHCPASVKLWGLFHSDTHTVNTIRTQLRQ